MNKTLFIIRGLPGSGKSTLGKTIAMESFAADDFFDEYYNGKFKPEKIKNAHEYCKAQVEQAMTWGDNPCESIAVCNTFTQDWEIKPYLDLAKRHGYTVHQIIVENTHGNLSVHNVPKETVEKMRKRFQINL